MVTLNHYLFVSAILFVIGVFGVLTRKNVIGVLMSIELIFNATNLNLVAFNHYLHGQSLWGHGFSIFVITLAAAESVVGLALILSIYRNLKTTQISEMSLMRE